MTVIQLLLEELERESHGSRKLLEQVPEGKNDWKPAEKSMPLGALATLVANMPGWLEMVLKMDELDINPKGGPAHRPPEWKRRGDLLNQLEASLEKAREVLGSTTDDVLFQTRWKLLSGGKLLSETSRYEAVRDGVMNHMSHHRG